MSTPVVTFEDLAGESRGLGGYSGGVSLGGRSLRWKFDDKGEVVVLDAKQHSHYVSFSELKLSRQDEAKMINAMLADFRRHAMPNGSRYFAASAVVTDDGHMFMATNNEVNIKDGFSGRGCAETTALRNAQDALQRTDVILDRVYLMSGQARRDAKGTLKDDEYGHVACLCGECRDNLRSHSRDVTQFVMLPTNDGNQELVLNAQAKAAADLKPGEAWVISREAMYPLAETKDIETRGISATARKGYLALTDASKRLPRIRAGLPGFQTDGTGHVRVHQDTLQALLKAYQAVDTSVPGLKLDGSLENVNRALLELVQKAYAEHAGRIPQGKGLKVTAVLLKSDAGDFYPGVTVEADWLPSKPQVFATALNNANNHIGFTDAYMMTLDTAQVEREMGAAQGGADMHKLAMPTSAAMGRLIKNMKGGTDATVHVLPINDGEIKPDELQKATVTFSVRDAFGPGFANPKSKPMSTAH